MQNHARKEKKIISECSFNGIKNCRLHYKCKECNDESYTSINGINKKFPNTYRFCNEDVNKFVLLLRKGVYLYEYLYMFILICLSLWITGKNLMKHHYQIKKLLQRTK